MFLATVVSFLSGVTIVVARSLNACLSEKTSSTVSTFYNYVVGLVTALVVWFLAVMLGGEFSLLPLQAVPWWGYLGGAVGVAAVTLLNILVVKVSSFYLTLLLFVGQVFTGVLLDSMLSGGFSWGRLAGGTAVAIGLSINIWLDKKQEAAPIEG